MIDRTICSIDACFSGSYLGVGLGLCHELYRLVSTELFHRTVPQNCSTELFHGSVFDADLTGRRVESGVVVLTSRRELTSTHVKVEE
jgi:hypothetical protein